MTANENTPDTVTLTADQGRALAMAGNLLTELWGDLASGDRLTLAALEERMDDAGLVETAEDGLRVISPTLVDAVVDVDVAIARCDGGWSGADWAGDVELAEQAFSGAGGVPP